jgi:glutaredoxin
VSRPLRWIALFAMASALVAGCRKDAPTAQDKPGAAPKSNELPPLEIRDDTSNLLVTWIDDKGDFHVVQKVGDVPREARDQVRVVVTTKEEGTGKLVYIANLNEVTPSGAYRVKTMSRAAWDELGASKRKARLEALAPSAPPPNAAAPSAEPSKSPGNPATGNVVAIIYGAEWCKPCHDAARYLKQRGVTVIDKDIEANEVAANEMRQKLARAGRGGASIPVIDVMGQIMVGFSPSQLDRAIEAAKNAKPL